MFLNNKGFIKNSFLLKVLAILLGIVKQTVILDIKIVFFIEKSKIIILAWFRFNVEMYLY